MINTRLKINNYIRFEDIYEGTFFIWNNYFYYKIGKRKCLAFNEVAQKYNKSKLFDKDTLCLIPNLYSFTFSTPTVLFSDSFHKVSIGDVFMDGNTGTYYLKTGCSEAYVLSVGSEDKESMVGHKKKFTLGRVVFPVDVDIIFEE